MEIIEIGKEQLVFLLSEGDIKKYEISAKESSDLLRDGYGRMLSDLKVDKRFLSGVLVEIFDSLNGGLQMFVTKIPDSRDLWETGRGIKKTFIYLFDDIGLLASACRALLAAESQESSLYINESDGRCYLFLEKEWERAGEFFGRRCKERAREYVAERCRFVCTNAIEHLSPLA